MVASISYGQEIGSLRWLDNNRELANDSSDWKWHRAIKEIKTGKNSESPVISFGGEDREQFRYYSHLNFGDVPPGVNDEDIYVQHRFLLHSDIRFSAFFRIFLQLNSCRANGRNKLLHQVDRDDLDIMQAFADLNFGDNTGMQLRIGRQEFSYGRERMLALRDGPTIRQNFDGLRFRTKYGRLVWDLLWAKPVLYKVGILDNSWREKEYVMGSYLTARIHGDNTADLYYFNASFNNAVFAEDTAYGQRNYVGIRMGKAAGSLSYDFEYTYQFGDHGTSKVSAWHLSSQIGYRFSGLPLKPNLILRESIFSGDHEDGDGEINTFRPISSKPPVYDLTPIGPANIILLSPEAEFCLAKNLSVTFRFLNVSRYSTEDGLYPSDMRKMTRAKNADGKHVMNGVACDILYIPNKHIALLLYGGIFEPGNYIRNTGKGNNLEALSLRAHYKF